MKRFRVLMVSLVLATVLCLALPGLASADITSSQWSETAYSGLDDFYGTTVVAYEAGSTAKLTVRVQNNTAGGRDITIVEAKIKFDWGSEYPATSYPTEIRSNESGVFEFEFTVPSNDVATNATLHSYQIIVGYQEQGVSYTQSRTANFQMGSGNGVNLDFYTDDHPVVPNTVVVSLVDTTADTITPATGYTVNDYLGRVSFTSPPANLIQVWAAYDYPVELGSGDGVNTVFKTLESPVVPGTLKVFKVNETTLTLTAVDAAAYTFVAETGEITFVTAPTRWEQIYAFYQYWSRFPIATGGDFAVYSADQLDANQLAGTYDSMYLSAAFPSTEGLQLEQEAEGLADLGDVEYANGNFASAEGYYQQAIDKMNEALAADTSLNTGVEDILTGLGTGAGAWIDSQAAKGDAEAAKLEAEADRIAALTDAEANKLNAEAGFADLYGVFLILIGVAGVLAAAGGIVWSVSRLVASRRM